MNSFFEYYFSDYDFSKRETAVCCPFPHYTESGLAYKETNPLYPVPELWNKEKFKKIYMLVGDINEKRNN